MIHIILKPLCYDSEIIDDLLEHYKNFKTELIRNYEHYDYDCLFIYS